MKRARGKPEKWEAEMLRERRLELGLSQHEVAEEAGIDLRHYQQFEYGVRRFSHCYFSIGLRICEVLELDPFEFVC